LGSYLLSLDGGRAAMTALADALFDDPRLAVDAAGAFDAGAGLWRLEAYLSARPSMAVLAAALADALAAAGLDDETAALTPRLHLRPVVAADYAAAGIDGLAPIVAGRFRVFGEHNRPAEPRRRDLVITASTAFGSGDHASTQLSLLLLDAILKTRRPRRVLDVGTGTGILALATAREAPHTAIVASDIDADSVRVAAANRHGNGVGTSLRLLHRAGLTARDFATAAPFDLVLANILPGPLAALSGDIARLAAPGADLVLAGLRFGEAARLVSVYGQHGFRLRRRVATKEWAGLWLTRPAAAGEG
jgi:ribosomal protein L11 methyltransferase